MTDISPNVVILTRDELRAREDKAFQRGVERGRFEARTTDARLSRNCANYQDGRCERCGSQWQGMEVGPDYKCPYFTPRPEVTGFRAIKPASAAHAAVLEDLARRIDDE